MLVPAIRICQLCKYYRLPRNRGWKFAVDELSLEIQPQEVFAFLGANGAGKTTTIKVLLDFLKPTSGYAEIFGIPTTCEQARESVGYLPEQPYFHMFLTPMEVLRVHTELLGLLNHDWKPAAQHILEMTGLTDYVDIPIAKLSKGLMQRVGIAQALVGDPKLLILDEPASGLDPIARRQTRDLLYSLKEAGKTIFLSSHLLSEIESVCDRVAILSHGKLVVAGTPDSIKKSEPLFAVTTAEMPVEARLKVSKLGGRIEEVGSDLIIHVESEYIFNLMHILERHKIPLISVSPARESLEDAFLRLAA